MTLSASAQTGGSAWAVGQSGVLYGSWRRSVSDWGVLYGSCRRSVSECSVLYGSWKRSASTQPVEHAQQGRLEQGQSDQELAAGLM